MGGQDRRTRRTQACAGSGWSAQVCARQGYRRSERPILRTWKIRACVAWPLAHRCHAPVTRRTEPYCESKSAETAQRDANGIARGVLSVSMFRFFEKALTPTAAPDGGEPPPGLAAFYWHFARQAKPLFIGLFVIGFIV